MTALAFALPAGLEVRAVELATLPAGRAALPLMVKNWHLLGKDAARTLQVEMAAPVSGSLVCRLDLVRHLSLASGPLTLRLPTPLNARTIEGFAGYRLEGKEASDKRFNVAVTSVTADVFGKVWQQAVGRDPGPLTRAYGFRVPARWAHTPSAIDPAPLHAGPGMDAAAAVGRRTGPGHPDQHHGRYRPGSVARCPEALTLADVGGTQVHHWSQHGSIVQVWLQQPRKQVELEISGWCKYSPPGRDRDERFLLPCVQLLGVVPEALATACILPRTGSEGRARASPSFAGSACQRNTHLHHYGNSLRRQPSSCALPVTFRHTWLLAALKVNQEQLQCANTLLIARPRGDAAPLRIRRLGSPTATADPGSERPPPPAGSPAAGGWTRMVADLASRITRSIQRDDPGVDDARRDVPLTLPTFQVDARAGASNGSPPMASTSRRRPLPPCGKFHAPRRLPGSARRWTIVCVAAASGVCRCTGSRRDTRLIQQRPPRDWRFPGRADREPGRSPPLAP